jgi:sigma-E factor negative regulatory protein RseC
MEHEGIIIAISPDAVQVQIRQESSCSMCHAQQACGIADAKEKIIEVPCKSGNYSKGDVVCIVGKTSMGLKAVLYAFIIPLLAGIVSLAVVSRIIPSEAVAAIASLGAITLYYTVLYFFRDKFKRKFIFTIK